MNKALRIAIADDEPDVRDYFQRILPRMGHEVVGTAANGQQLIELCREHKPDLIIADIRMPELDGDVAIREICSERPTPFILISAYSKPLSSLDGLPQAESAYLTKPIKRELLKDTIERLRLNNASE